MALDTARAGLERAAEKTVEARTQIYVALAAKLDALSPLKVLGRGYSIAEKDGKAVRNAAEVRPGDRIGVHLTGGKLDCLVEGVAYE